MLFTLQHKVLLRFRCDSNENKKSKKMVYAERLSTIIMDNQQPSS